MDTQEALLLVHLKTGHYLYSKYRFKSSPPNENGAELFSMTLPSETVNLSILHQFFSLSNMSNIRIIVAIICFNALTNINNWFSHTLHATPTIPNRY